MNISTYINDVYRQVYNFISTGAAFPIDNPDVISENDKTYQKYSLILNQNLDKWIAALKQVNADDPALLQTVAMFSACKTRTNKYGFDDVMSSIDLLIKVLERFVEDENCEIDLTTYN